MKFFFFKKTPVSPLHTVFVLIYTLISTNDADESQSLHTSFALSLRKSCK